MTSCGINLRSFRKAAVLAQALSLSKTKIYTACDLSAHGYCEINSIIHSILS